MRYQPAMALGALAAGQAAASNHAHANFHKRHDVQARGADAVNWATVAYDLSAVDWSKVNYGNSPAPSPAAATPAPETPASSQPEVVATPVAEAASSPKAAAAAPAASSSGDIAGDILNDIQTYAAKLGAQVGANDESDNGKIWIGDGGKHSATFTNTASNDAIVWCWAKATMWINANQPLISVKLSPGESQKLSAADGFSGGCGVSFPDSDLYMGLLDESILEFTFGSGANGCFDISREINMKGIQLTAKGTKCTSGLDGSSEACTFVCTDSTAARCGSGNGDYTIDVGTSTLGPCMVGKDPYTGDASGGCMMADDGEHLDVTIHGSRW